ncbi:MAG: hypothetical protein HQL17_05280 [Candidatus Omnitrophica bacterium]|nr:hypothetical protein [Candidatus Omnitrophota bacterium]
MKRLVPGLIAALWVLSGLAWSADKVPVPGRAVIAFDGVLDLKARALSLSFGALPESPLAVKVTRVAPDRYDLHADIRHIMTPLSDVAAVLDGKLVIVGTEYAQRELVGEMSTRYTLLNYKPVRDLYMKFSVRKKRLNIDPFWLGVFSGRGAIDLVGDHNVDVALDVMSTDLEDVWELMRLRGMSPPPLSGIVTGAVSLKGPAAKLTWDGQLSAYNGTLKHFDYERIDLRFDGKYPVIRLKDGAVVSAEGPRFKVEGALDLSDMTRISTQLRQLKRDFVVSENDSGRAWTFSRLSDRPEQATQLKSFISGGLDGRSDGVGAIGLQKHIGF